MKILVIRLSSIGDIVLTTPIVRCLYHQKQDVKIHYLCKPSYLNILQSNPYINQVHVFDKQDTQLISSLCSEKFDYIVDLQNNKYSRRLCRQMNVLHATFPKLNLRKWILVNFKINLMPDKHVVDRYFEALKPVGVINDGKGLDYFLTELQRHDFTDLHLPEVYIAIAVGSKHITKQMPKDKLLSICEKISIPIVFLGDENDEETAKFIINRLDKPMYNLCGKLTLSLSAACIEKASHVLTGDTGLMHIAAAFNKRIISVWGNTVPAFGMYPYMPENKNRYVIIEKKKLYCRPCSKLGFKRCPHGHFKCMRDLMVEEIVKHINN